METQPGAERPSRQDSERETCQGWRLYDTCVLAGRQKSTALCSPCPASLRQPTPASQGRGSDVTGGGRERSRLWQRQLPWRWYLWEPGNNHQVGGGVAVTEIRTNHSSYLSLASNRRTDISGHLSCALSAVLYLYCCVSLLSCIPFSGNPMDCSPPGSFVHWISQIRILEWVTISSPGDLPDLGTEPTSPTLAGRFFTTQSPGKP